MASASGTERDIVEDTCCSDDVGGSDFRPDVDGPPLSVWAAAVESNTNAGLPLTSMRAVVFVTGTTFILSSWNSIAAAQFRQ